MKAIGLLGGMSWESTALYYRLINEATRKALGGLHSAPIAMFSVDFQEIGALQHAGDWDATARILASYFASSKRCRVGAKALAITRYPCGNGWPSAVGGYNGSSPKAAC